jgi:mRNA interferase HigB
MHIISIKMLREFWQKHPAAEPVLRQWHSIVEQTDFRDFGHIREFFNSADYVPPYVVFDVAGNNYRVVVVVQYRARRIYVREVMMHREYDEWCKRYRKGKV